ncbi:MAG: bifunctional pyr operon transcriptional regulator/uracil phosphoribosyltransferase PyrR [Chitinophagaceae bacterium]|nr:bifunctional pyr operon transcriptional regulator/uracil phosphoribosyltransferase PyrR [Chitinophagaceae bacterium]
MKTILDQSKLADLIQKLVNQLSKAHPSLDEVVFLGIQQGGVILANDIIASLKKIRNTDKINYGQLDITFYRDDIRKEILAPDTMNIPFDIENKQVILIDDVLFTGRTIKAALDALLDYGRPAKVELCVLIDRKEHRQFPIQADYIGEIVQTNKSDKVKLINGEVVLVTA